MRVIAHRDKMAVAAGKVQMLKLRVAHDRVGANTTKRHHIKSQIGRCETRLNQRSADEEPQEKSWERVKQAREARTDRLRGLSGFVKHAQRNSTPAETLVKLHTAKQMHQQTTNGLRMPPARRKS
jgi:hypothetical protein